MSDKYLESSGTPSDTILDEDETILLHDRTGHLPKGKYESEKCVKQFLGSRIVRDLALLKANVRAKALGKRKAFAKVGDLISVPSELFDESPGSYSKGHPRNFSEL
jgi:hypothetical protein